VAGPATGLRLVNAASRRLEAFGAVGRGGERARAPCSEAALGEIDETVEDPLAIDAQPIVLVLAREPDAETAGVCVLSAAPGVSGVDGVNARPVRLRYGQTPGSARRH